ncbi:MAG: hypothetical protein Q4B70_06220 [Lachnospiraceae bacterium]|nr:hypothetical protein [Lachnospiraceae bacterium]
MKIIEKILTPLFLLSFGGMAYYMIEIVFRGESHYSMMLCGGLAFLSVSLFHRHFENRMMLLSQMILSSLIITGWELLFGLYFNIHLDQDVWDYSNQLIQYRGQISLTFSVLWFFLSFPIFYIEKWIRTHLFSQ